MQKWLISIEHGATDLSNALASLRRHRVGLKGIVYTPVAGRQPSFNVAIRRSLDLFANVVHIRNHPGSSAGFPR